MQGIAKAFSKMRQVLYRRGQKREDIDDLMQDAFVRLLEYCKSGAEVREPEAMLVTTVQRLAINQVRTRRRQRYADEPVENLGLIDTSASPEEVFAVTERLRQMRKTLDTLAPRTREILFLQRLHGYSYAQIAEATGMPISTIEKHVARGLALLLEERSHGKEHS
jgi:RNA polymerase sigma factor (sigma-70 family)